jgi:hypothetical protein
VTTLAALFLLVPLIGSFYPVPAWPVDSFPYIFLGYMLLGSGWLFAVSRRNPGIFGEIEMDLESSMLSSAKRTEEVDRIMEVEGMEEEGGAGSPVPVPIPAVTAEVHAAAELG